MIEHIEYRGKLIHECTLPGETRADDVFPAHPNAIQVSARRFLLVYATRTYRGGDDDLSIVYQLRDGAYDGPVLAEGILAKSVNDWDPFDDGSAYVRQHGHPVAFGVPRGALIQGQPAPNANLFVAKWRVCARIVDPATGFLVSSRSHPDLSERTQGVEWVQLRLNGAEDDIEIVQPAQRLRQRGYEEGDAFCSAAVLTMNQSFVQAVPFNADASEWADVNHFDGGRLAALKYRYNPQRGVYEWVEMGPLIAEQLFEASLARYRGSWVISGRPHGGGAIGWFRTTDPFGAASPSARPTSPVNSSPLTAYTYADGVLRVLTGDNTISPYGLNRNPLYLWDIDPEHGFAAAKRRAVFDIVAARLPIPVESRPTCDMAKLLPHAGGKEQIIVYRVRSGTNNDPSHTGAVITPPEKETAGIYYAAVQYAEAHPGVWQFATDGAAAS